MKNTLIILTTILTLTVHTYAGSKNVAPIEAEVLPVPVVINPIPLYIGIGLVASAVSKECPCVEDERQKDMTYGAIFRAGWDINQYVGLEARYLKANLEKDFSTTTSYGLFLKPQYHVSNQMNVYGLLGYAKTIVEGCALDNGELEESGLSYGVGFEYDFSDDTALGPYSRMFDGQGDQEKGWGLWADYQNLFHNEGALNVKTNVFSAGITYDF